MAAEPRGSLSLAQVEEELRSAEAYLTASAVPPPPITSINDTFNSDISTIEWNPRDESVEDANFRRKLKTRPILSEERRREILAKLSSERQTALRDRHIGAELYGDNLSDELSEEKTYRTPEERHRLVQKLLSERNANADSESAQVHDIYLETSPVSPIGEAFQYGESADNDMSSVESEDDEIYYASDILDNTAVTDDIQPRSRLDFIFEGEETRENAGIDTQGVFATKSTLMSNAKTEVDEPVSPSLFVKLLKQEKDGEMPGVLQNSFDDDHQYPDESWRAANELQDGPFEENAATFDQRDTESKRPMNRIDFLAQPRNQAFVDREKQRILLEMEQLQECTFRPNILQPPRSISKAKALDHKNLSGRPGTAGFQWLTLSPRQNNSRREPTNKDQNVIQRLHLDGASRYESREEAREALEAQQLEECTFKPKINPASKSMFSMADYKPIHHRIPDLQRAKAEYIERIREQLDLEASGPLSFTPTINPKSREIATIKLAEKEAEEFNPGKHSFHKVTDRLAEDADAIAERRMATQEYFDMLNDQPFAPNINETSRKIVEQKPEFKMDFVARQEYFQSRDQEKMEALEDFCDKGYARGERLTFKPNIGNAEGVLQQLRPERCTESSQQKLYRLAYNDQREAELKKQRLREEEFAQYTFKPEINPVSKALGKSTSLDELSHPVLDIEHNSSVSKRSPQEDRKAAGDSSTSRVALRQYFANKRFRSRVALEMEEASKAECTFQPTLIASKYRSGNASTSKLYSKEPRTRKKVEWQSENLLHLIEAERQQKADKIEAKRNAQELKDLEECTFQPNLDKPRRKGKSGAKGSPSPPRNSDADEKPVIVRGLGRFLELRELARKQQEEQKQREQKVFAPNTAYEPRTYTVPKPFKLSESSKESIRRHLKVREEMRAKERQECTFRPQTVSSQSRRVLQNMLNS